MSVNLSEIVAVILAGGLGTRIQHLLPNLPKPMAPVRGRPCLEWLVRYLAGQGIRRILISTGHLSEVIERHFATRPVPGVNVRCVPEPRPLGTGGGFLNAVQASGEVAAGWLVLNGDTFALAELAQATGALENEATAGVIYARAVADTSRYGSLVTDASGNLVRFEEKRPGQGLISAGVYLFRDELVRTFPERWPLSAGLKSVASAILADVEPGFQPGGKIPATEKGLVKSERRRPTNDFSGRQDAALYGRPGGPPLLFPPLSLERDVFPALTSAGALIKVLPMATPFLDIGTPETLPAADPFIRDNLAWFGPSPL